MTYDQLRMKCIRFWGMHPETKGTLGELWADLNSHGPTMRRNVAEPSES